MFDAKEGPFTIAAMLVPEIIRRCGLSEARVNECSAAALAAMLEAEQGNEELLKLCQANRMVMEAHWHMILEGREDKTVN